MQDITVAENLMALRQLVASLQQQLTEQQAMNIVLNARLMNAQVELAVVKQNSRLVNAQVELDAGKAAQNGAVNEEAPIS